MGTHIVVADLEADGLLEEATKVHCAVFKNKKTGQLTKFTPESVDNIPAFLDTVDVLIMHNGIGYDLPLLEKLYGYKYKGKVIDTMVMSQTMRLGLSKPAGYGRIGPHSIEAYGIRYGRYKPENEDWSVFTEHMLHRCTEDVEITDLVYDDLMENEYTEDWRMPLRMTHKFFELTSMMERSGWLFDGDKARRLIRILEYLIHRIDRVAEHDFPHRLIRKYKEPLKKPFKKNGELSAHALDWLERYGQAYKPEDIAGPFSRITFEPFNLGSIQQVSAYLLADGWIPKEWNYKKDKAGRLIYGDDGEPIPTSPKLSQKDDFEGVTSPHGKRLARRVQLSHRKSYLEGLLKTQRPDGRIGCGVAGLAKTYRVRHRGIVNTPNAKAYLGKHIRSLFTCPEGRKLVSVDATSCQVRMEGAYARDKGYANMLLKEDTHTIVMNAVNRVMNRIRQPEITRDFAKNYNFALKFGAQDPKLGKMAGLGAKEGAMIRASINQEFGAQDALIKRLQNEWRRNAVAKKDKWGRIKYEKGYIKGLDGRPIYVDAEYKCLVYALQSAETIFMQAAFCFFYKLLTKHGYVYDKDYIFVCHYHDEYTAEVFDPSKAEHVKELGELAMKQASDYFELYVPQQGDGATGNNWAEVH